MVDNLPLILQYFIPGAWCLIIYRFSMSKKIDDKNYFIFSFVISYVLLAMTSLFKYKFVKFAPDNPIINSAVSIIIGSIIVISIVILTQRKWFKRITVKVLHKTLNDDIWRDVFDLKNGSNLKIYIKDKDYYLIGHLKNYEEKGNNSWIALKSFAKFDKETNANYKNEPSFLNTNNAIITVRFSDIEHIEIF